MYATYLYALFGGPGADLSPLIVDLSDHLSDQRVVTDLHSHHVNRTLQYIGLSLELPVK